MKLYIKSSILSIIVALPCFGDNLDIPNDILKKIDGQFSNASKNYPAIEISNNNDLKKVVCYSGSLVEQVGLMFDVFPELGFFRIRVFGNVNNSDWLYIKIKIENPEKIAVTLKDGSVRLRKDIESKLTACGSGLLFKDLNEEVYSYRRNNEYWVVTRQTKDSGVFIPAFKILIRDSDGKQTLESFSRYNWGDLLSEKE